MARITPNDITGGDYGPRAVCEATGKMTKIHASHVADCGHVRVHPLCAHPKPT
ncbi:hypothetical protein [Sagittula stellata]|uniref:hypothetical protein n=1 Tax=Sagittula stellata TaxID=52603 RepID=UPI0018DE996E|nr:hypothetical protein [Sagittula stellata]